MTTDPRVDPPLTGSERETLRSFLDWHRATLQWKCAGLSEDQLRRKASAPSQAWSNWRAEVARSREIEAAAPDLETSGVRPRNGATYSLRWILVHMIEEYARHNGHADFLREAIDGETGE